MLMALSLACLGRERLVASAVLMALATLVKIYPALVAVLMIRYLSVDRRKTAAWASAYGLSLLAFLAATLWLSGWEATLAPYRFQLARDSDSLSLYGTVFPGWLGENTPLGKVFRLGAVLSILTWLTWTATADLSSLLRRGAIILAIFVALQVFYSPQWIVWLTPLLIPLIPQHRPLMGLLVGLDLVTFFTFPIVYDFSTAYQTELLTILVFLRALVLAALAAYLIWAEFRKGGLSRMRLAN
jgi:hypothetical protein